MATEYYFPEIYNTVAHNLSKSGNGAGPQELKEILMKLSEDDIKTLLYTIMMTERKYGPSCFDWKDCI